MCSCEDNIGCIYCNVGEITVTTRLHIPSGLKQSVRSFNIFHDPCFIAVFNGWLAVPAFEKYVVHKFSS